MLRAKSTLAFLGYTSGEITKDQLGTNLLFHADRVAEGDDFTKVIKSMETSFIRFPGGTISEQFFDLSNPNASNAVNAIDTRERATPETRSVLSLSEYLAFAAEAGARSAIVLPTYRFFDQRTGQIDPNAEAEIKGFVENLLAGAFGEVNRPVLELGNEWYQNRFTWSTEEFAALQARMAAWVDDAARAAGHRENVTVLAQVGRTEGENVTLASAFQGPAAATIDGAVTHLYGTNAAGDPLGIGYGVGNRLAQINTVWQSALGPEFDLAVTEWNVGEDGADNTTINGLMRTAPLLRMFSEMVENDVDLATIWATQTAGPAGLSGREGTGAALSPTGKFYAMLNEGVEGKQMVRTGAAPWLTDAAGKQVGYNYAFSDENDVTVFYASAVDSRLSLDIDLTAFMRPDAYVYASVLGAAPGETGTEYLASAAIKHLTDIDLTASGAPAWQHTETLAAYEMLALHVVVGSGVQISGDTQFAVADRLVGSRHADTLEGHDGRDTLTGGQGNDSLLGGAYKDLIDGGNEEDLVDGGSGGDSLLGGRGDDTLAGGQGDDTLAGGVGLDTLNGGNDNDTLAGNEDSDMLDGWFGDDVLEGGQGWDLLVGGHGQDTLHGGTENDTLLGGDHDDALHGGTGDDLLLGQHHSDRLFGEAGDDILEGGKADDTLDGGTGRDVVSGGTGADLVQGGAGADTLWGYTGDDTLTGGAGDDVLRGEAGADLFLYFDGFGHDTIHGFEASGALDKIDLRAVSTVDSFEDLLANHLAQDGADVVIDTGVGTIRLAGTDLADLGASDFLA